MPHFTAMFLVCCLRDPGLYDVEPLTKPHFTGQEAEHGWQIPRGCGNSIIVRYIFGVIRNDGGRQGEIS